MNESVKPKFDGQYKVARAAIASNEKSGARLLTQFDRIVPIIQAAIEAGEIISTQWDDVKYYIDHFVEDAYNMGVSHLYIWGGRYQALPEELRHLDLPSYVRNVNTLAKKLAKVKAKDNDMYKACRALTDELMNLYEVSEYLKAHMVKASVKKAQAKAAKQEEEAAYQKKYTNHKDVMKVVELLKGKAAEVERGIYESQLKWLTKTVQVYIEKCKTEETTDYREIFKTNIEAAYLLQNLCERTGDWRKREFTLHKDWKKLIDKKAKQTASDIVDHFVYKNSGKLSYILYTKNNMKSVELVHVSVSRGAVEATLKVEFEDGSGFQADSSVVFVISKLGTPFYRYPTIFRMVKMPDGSKLSGPSEQKMDEVFAIAK